MANVYRNERMTSPQMVSLMRRINALEARARLEYVDYQGFIGQDAAYDPTLGYNDIVYWKRLGHDGLVYQHSEVFGGFSDFGIPLWTYQNVIKVYGLDNVLIRQFTLPAGATPLSGLQVDQYGNLYIARPRGVVKRSGVTGATLWDNQTIAPAGTNNYSMTISATGEIYFASGRTVYRVNTNGAVQNSWTVSSKIDYPKICYAMDYEEYTSTLWVWVWTEGKIKAYQPSTGTLKQEASLPAALNNDYQLPYGGPNSVNPLYYSQAYIPPMLSVDVRRVFSIGPAYFASMTSEGSFEQISSYTTHTGSPLTEPITPPTPNGVYAGYTQTLQSMSTLYQDYLLHPGGFLYRLGALQTPWWDQDTLPQAENWTVPDGGVLSPALDLLAEKPLRSGTLTAMRAALKQPTRVARVLAGEYDGQILVIDLRTYGLWYSRPLWRYFRNYSTGNLYTWTNSDTANNVYYRAMGDRSAYGGAGPRYDWTHENFGFQVGQPYTLRCYDIDVGEIAEIIARLEASEGHYE